MWKMNIQRTLTAQQRINDALIKFMENTNREFELVHERLRMLEKQNQDLMYRLKTK